VNIDKYNTIVESIYNKYNILDSDAFIISNVINEFIGHPEFKRRMSNEFLHHDKTTLGYHILEDTVVTYKLCKKKNLSDKETTIALKIAMMHDLYVSPWQNNISAKDNKFFNKHGFRHPLEAVINAITWYPEMFQNEREAKIIIDGIIHHMYPLPVRVINSSNFMDIELNNLEYFIKLDKKYKNMIYDSCNRCRLANISLARTRYIEGTLMRKADKISSLDNFTSIKGILALVTGVNNKI
jgi:hypothetical protein